MAWIEEGRMHPDGQATVDPLGGPDQLEPEAELTRVLEVIGLDVLDPFVDHLVDVDRRVKCQPGQDRHLGCGVRAIDVVGGIGLRVPQALRLLKGLAERLPRASHLGQDEIRCAVDDPVDAVDPGAGERLLKYADHRHHACNRSLEPQLHTLGAGHLPKLLAVTGQKLLVGRHHVAPGSHRPQHVFMSGLDPAQ